MKIVDDMIAAFSNSCDYCPETDQHFLTEEGRGQLTELFGTVEKEDRATVFLRFYGGLRDEGFRVEPTMFERGTVN